MRAMISLCNSLADYDHHYRGVDIHFIKMADHEQYRAVELEVEAGLYTIRYMFTYEMLYHTPGHPKEVIKQYYSEAIQMAHYYIDEHWREYRMHGMGD